MESAVCKQLNETLVVDVVTACKISTLGRSYLYELLNNGSIASIKRGKRRLIIYASLKQFLTMQAASQGEWKVPPCNIA
jgi:excisionase family DNA binding protein